MRAGSSQNGLFFEGWFLSQIVCSTSVLYFDFPVWLAGPVRLRHQLELLRGGDGMGQTFEHCAEESIQGTGPHLDPTDVLHAGLQI